MTEEEVPLSGGDVTVGVVRVGGTVRRPRSRSTPAVHALLRHVAAAGFDGAPRALGHDRDGREMLTFVVGEVPARPLPDWAATTEALAGLGGLLRRFHDATAGLVLPSGVTWPELPPLPAGLAPEPAAEVIGHADVTPDNVVFTRGRPAALIDFDLARPLARRLELAIAACHWVPILNPADRPPALEGVDERARLAVLCDGYDLSDTDRSELVEVIAGRLERSWWRMRQRAAAEPGSGWERMWDAGVGDKLRRSAAWLDHHRDHLRSAL